MLRVSNENVAALIRFLYRYASVELRSTLLRVIQLTSVVPKLDIVDLLKCLPCCLRRARYPHCISVHVSTLRRR